MSPVVLLLAVLVGMALGLLGGGGSILTVPLLVYIAGLDAKEAIATSLLVVGVTSLAALVPVSYTHLRAHETVLDLVCRLLLEKKKYTVI